ncbi:MULTISPECIES: potassium-transporting ATPase subunit KdpC [Pseudomonas]|uniref:Potassium-transporting ATPase KdpC subunit n=2 Tax=Pseudomonadaceae TaxID=135621 RepID=A0A7Z0BRI4_9GAMM|nr:MULTISPECIES: potassium-transporting ATPase subunit KdpC [Pseudomonas]MCW2291233.1 K+-transporting ATPase ATPase C chain [Pseudomonas sp. BIGb0408]NYH74196.1 K+-transporting ATPase ATPase C chain [Pseudomonas flavescens]
MNDMNVSNRWFSHLRPAVAMLALLTLVTGAAYPVFVTVIAQSLFAHQANGSLMRDDSGAVRGSWLIAQQFDGQQWFQSRPSAGGFATVASGASNLSPSNPALAERVAADTSRWGATEQRRVPLALVTTSGSGLDPQLPLAAVLYQVPRVAAARGITAEALQRQVESMVQRSPIGPALVNVLALNASLAGLGAEVEVP